MKFKNWKELVKGKASAGLLLTGVMAVAVVTAITLSKGAKTEESPQIDLNEKLDQADDNSNDKLLEFDDYAGNLPSTGGDTIHNQVDITGPGALDMTQKEDTTQPNPTANPQQQTSDQTSDPVQENEQNQELAAVDNDNQTSNENLGQADNTQVADNKTKTEQTPEQETTQEVSGVTVESLSFHLEDGISWPVHGEILLPFSPDHAVYHKTLNQFKVNPALLIGCEPGTQILVPVRGIITGITETPQTGVTITMAVGDDYFLVYGQMEKSDLEVGKVLEAGDTIGTVAKATKYYTLEGDHLYFQILHENESIDPMQYLRTE